MGFTDLAIVAAFVALYGLVSGRLATVAITPPLVFMAFGLAVGPEALDLVALDVDEEFVKVLSELALVLVLFTDAARIDLRVLRAEHNVPIRLLGIGLPLVVGAGAGLAMVLLPGIGGWEAAVLGAALAATDAALSQVVVSSRLVPVRVRQAINIESGLNDGIALPLLTVFIALAAGEGFDAGSFVAEQLGYGLIAGAAIGTVGGFAVRRASATGWMSPRFQQLATLGLALAAFGTASAVDGNGFIAAFVAGGAFGYAAREECGGVYAFAEEEGQLLNLLVFMIFGGAVLGPALGELTWQIGLYAALSLTVVRMVPVAISLAGSGLQRDSVAFLGWFGPRGLASIIFGLIIIEESGIPGADEIFLVITWTVATSVVAHGLSARPLSWWYARHVGSLGASRRDIAETVEVSEQHLRVPLDDDPDD